MQKVRDNLLVAQFEAGIPLRIILKHLDEREALAHRRQLVQLAGDLLLGWFIDRFKARLVVSQVGRHRWRVPGVLEVPHLLAAARLALVHLVEGPASYTEALLCWDLRQFLQPLWHVRVGFQGASRLSEYRLLEVLLQAISVRLVGLGQRVLAAVICGPHVLRDTIAAAGEISLDEAGPGSILGRREDTLLDRFHVDCVVNLERDRVPLFLITSEHSHGLLSAIRELQFLCDR